VALAHTLGRHPVVITQDYVHDPPLVGGHGAQTNHTSLSNRLVSFGPRHRLQAAPSSLSVPVCVDHDIVVAIRLMIQKSTEQILERVEVSSTRAHQSISIAPRQRDPDGRSILVDPLSRRLDLQTRKHVGHHLRC